MPLFPLSQRIKVTIFIVGSVSVLLLGYFSIDYFIQQKKQIPNRLRKIERIEKGQIDFVAYDLEGRELYLSSFYGQYVLLNFWATWCAPCVTELPALNALAKLFSGRLIVLAVTSEEITEIKKFFRAFDPLSSYFIPMHMNHSDMLSIFDIKSFPESYLLNKKGRLVKKIIGPQKWDSSKWTAHIKQLMEE